MATALPVVKLIHSQVYLKLVDLPILVNQMEPAMPAVIHFLVIHTTMPLLVQLVRKVLVSPIRDLQLSVPVGFVLQPQTHVV
jgi:hypothetical protein